MKPRCFLLGLLLAGCAGQQAQSVAPTSAPASSATVTTAPTLSPTAAATPRPRLDGDELAALVRRAALRAHLEALQRIADATSGRNRATGTPGFDASVEYVVATLEGAGYEVERQEFSAGGMPSTNVLAERRGTSEGMVIVGAHLDSVAAGPGINDNGSGVATLLVVAEHLAGLPPPDLTIRFAFWGAEEGGPHGSRAYVESLSTDELAAISAYLNLDMLASPNAVRFVYEEDDAPAGSEALTELLASSLVDAGFSWDPIDVDRRSDHRPFAAAAVPIGGLFSGGREPVTREQAARHGATAGQPSDPCSDAACDMIDNVDLATHLEMTGIVARVLVVLATEGR